MNWKKRIKTLPGIDYILWCKYISNKYLRMNKTTKSTFIKENFNRIKYIRNDNKICQFQTLAKSVDVLPAENNDFFYSIDSYKTIKHSSKLYDNMTVDYSMLLKCSFRGILEQVKEHSDFYEKESAIVSSLRMYYERVQNLYASNEKYTRGIQEIGKMFDEACTSFFGSLQRILFANQWLWQTGHMDNGLGHLDWLLWPYLEYDLNNNLISIEEAKQYIKSFMICLHSFFWAKSEVLAGDTGQIIVLGGLSRKENYYSNLLTQLFIECSKDLCLPDPKILLRVSCYMPKELLVLAIDCISTGIGGPVLSNDDVIIPKLLAFGYDKEQAYHYVTAACWEPMIIERAIEQNNMAPLNFARPFALMLGEERFLSCTSTKEILSLYFEYLDSYLDSTLYKIDNVIFEEDPLVSLFLSSCVASACDVSQKGDYSFNLGLTGVGLSTVVNSILNLDTFVFKEHKYTLKAINQLRSSNFDGNRELVNELSANNQFGKDEEHVIQLTNAIFIRASSTVKKHSTAFGGKYKIGLSSPYYIIDSKLSATFDGRLDNDPLDVHISARNPVSPTELLSFGASLDYNEDRFNANVVDFILPPYLFQNHYENIVSLIYGAIKKGTFQIQINVIKSDVLIEAQRKPEQFKNLIVRVWGFSAYFVELPKEYQDNLIRRALESEKTYG